MLLTRPATLLLLLLVLHAEAVKEGNKTKAPILDLYEGRISGKVLTSEGGRQYFAYLGIPYAKPPVGDLRFKFPRRDKETKWDGVRAFNKDPPKCPQLSYPERMYEGDEDCLYLNVYTHKVVEDREIPVDDLVKQLRPVLVWLHGGNFQHGSGTFDDVGPERFMDNEEDLVLVVPNYRLGALGFLSIGEHPAVGNAGMKDQFLALSWVHGHITSFGGHPGRVTLGGFEAGGASAHLHALSPLSSHEPNMFSQTLSMSGTALSPWAVLTAEEATRRALKLGKSLGCVRSGKGDVKAADVVRCLRTKPAEDIVRASPTVLDWFTDISFPFVPSVEVFDGHNRPFMIAHPLQTLKDKIPGLKPKTWVTGGTTHDGLPQSLQLLVFPGMLRDLNEHFEERIWDFLGMSHIAGPEERRRAGRRLRDYYLPDGQTISMETLSGIIDLASDAMYYHGMHTSLQLHNAAKKAPTLIYRFGYDRHVNRDRILGVPLGTDVELLFPAVFAKTKTTLSEEEAVVSKKMLRLVTNYVFREDPTPEKEDFLDNVEWPTATGVNFSFLDVGLNGEFSLGEGGLYPERMALWDMIQDDLQYKSQTDKKHDRQDHKEKDEL